MRHEVRAVTRKDEDALYDLAQYLNSVNLPHDREAIRTICELSESSFSGQLGDPKRAEFVFLVTGEDGQALGTSMIIGQLGRRDAPYIYFDVLPEERYSATLDAHFEHQVLSIGYSFNGPTEIGGLVVRPDQRKSKAKVGTLVSYVRFGFIALYRSFFQKQIVAELLPPLSSDGTSFLWEAVGRRFTNLSYREADHLSKKNKEFIRTLFPDGDIYASLLSKEAQEVIGKVGAESQGVERMLKRLGFRYLSRIDPFDGGPHFGCQTDDISLVAETKEVKCVAAKVDAPIGQPGILMADFDGPPFFRAAIINAAVEPGQGGSWVLTTRDPYVDQLLENAPLRLAFTPWPSD